MRYFKRVAESKNAFTQGKTYAILHTEGNDVICNDEGFISTIAIHMPSYWVEVKGKQAKEINKMLNIEAVTLVNGKNSDELEVNELLDFIESEENNLDRLQKFKHESKAIDKLKVKHLKNINLLNLILGTKV